MLSNKTNCDTTMIVSNLIRHFVPFDNTESPSSLAFETLVEQKYDEEIMLNKIQSLYVPLSIELLGFLRHEENESKLHDFCIQWALCLFWLSVYFNPIVHIRLLGFVTKSTKNKIHPTKIRSANNRRFFYSFKSIKTQPEKQTTNTRDDVNEKKNTQQQPNQYKYVNTLARQIENECIAWQKQTWQFWNKHNSHGKIRQRRMCCILHLFTHKSHARLEMIGALCIPFNPFNRFHIKLMHNISVKCARDR